MTSIRTPAAFPKAKHVGAGVPPEECSGADYLYADRRPPKLDPSFKCGQIVVWPDGEGHACARPAGHHLDLSLEHRYHQVPWHGGWRTWEIAGERELTRL